MSENKSNKVITINTPIDTSTVTYFPNNRNDVWLGCLSPFKPTFDFNKDKYPYHSSNKDKYTQEEFYNEKNKSKECKNSIDAWSQDEKSKERLRILLKQFPGYTYFD